MIEEDMTSQIHTGHDSTARPPCCSPVCAQLCETPFIPVCCTCPYVLLPLNSTSSSSSTDYEVIAQARNQHNSRYDNFYNNYNVDYRKPINGGNKNKPSSQPIVKRLCEDVTRTKNSVQPTEPKKLEQSYFMASCCRPCCEHNRHQHTHSNQKQGICLYNEPCRAHCYDHPPGIKPSGRFP